MSYVIVGLGNKGAKYQDTRHNAGRMALSAFVRGLGGSFVSSQKYAGMIWKGTVGGCEVLALLPETYMNESGGSVKKAVTRKNAERLIVLYDDMDLPLGSIRVSFDRGSGGHNGLRSVAGSLGTEKFVRIRVGISPNVGGEAKKPKGEEAVLAFVMGEFSKNEKAMLNDALLKTAEAIPHIIEHGHASAMNTFN